MTTIDTTQGPRTVTAASDDPYPPGMGASTTDALPDPISALLLSGDPGAELAALAVQSGEQQETTAQTSRDVEQRLEVTEDNQQVDDMRKKADDIRAGGIWDGAGMMVEGGASVTGACMDCRRVGEAVGHSGAIAKGFATIGGAFAKADAAEDDANADAAKSAADQARSAADDLHDAKKNAGDFISAALDFYREYTSSQASAASAALHRA